MTKPRVHLIPALKDNYLFVAENTDSGACFIVDPGEAEPIRNFLQQTSLRPEAILLTHHHHDHIEGVAELAATYPQLRIFGPPPSRSDFTAFEVREGSMLQIAGFAVEVWHLPGHTLNHVAYLLPETRDVFVGDVLFGLGCGRLFEGTPEQAFSSLQRFTALAPETLIYCAHEYTETNLRFCESQGLTPAGFAEHAGSIREHRQRALPTVPLQLGNERRFNPFLTAPDVATFRIRRQARNEFRG